MPGIELADQFCERGEDVKTPPAIGVGCVQTFAQRPKAEFPAAQRLDQIDQLVQGMGKPVQAEDGKNITGPEIIQAGRQFAARHHISGLAIYIYAETADFFERPDVTFQVMGGTGNRDVTDRHILSIIGHWTRKWLGPGRRPAISGTKATHYRRILSWPLLARRHEAWSYEPCPDAVRDQLADGPGTGALTHSAEVALDRTGRNSQASRDLLAREAPGHKLDNFHLTGG